MAYSPRRGEFLVNTQTLGDQAESDVAALDDGSFVVVWRDQVSAPATPPNPNGSNILAQRYDAAGAAIGGEFLVNTQATGNQVRPQVGGIDGGGFVVAWSDASGVSDGSFSSVNAQIFNSGGGKVGSELVVNSQAFSTQSFPAIGRLTNGGFVVTWADFVGFSVKAQVYTAGGASVGGELTVDTQTGSTQEQPGVAGLSNGRFVIVWGDNNTTAGDNSGYSVKAQLYAAGGTTIGGEFLVNTTTVNDQHFADVTALVGGGFVVTWRDGSGPTKIKAQLFDSAGAKTGGELTVNTTGGALDEPSVSALSTGGFVIAWQEAPLSNANVRAQVFGPTGALDGSEFLVKAQTGSFLPLPAVVGLKDGGFGVVWVDRSGTLGDSSGSSINAQLYQFQTGPGDDSVQAPLGNARIDGLGGIDTITFSFRLVDAHVSYVGNTVVIDGPSSHTVLTGFEKYAFTDGTVNNADGDVLVDVLVDDLFYYSTYRDIWDAHADADAHYHSVGWKEGRDPDAFFSTTLYRALYADVKALGIDPLRHFDQGGWKEGRLPSTAFDPAAYLAANPDVKAAGVDPLAHFLGPGAGEGRQPFAAAHPIGPRGFDYVYYLQSNPDVAASGADPLTHFQQFGWKEGRNPNALFDVNGYLANYADVKAAGINPLDHYNQFGWHEGRDPSVSFDTTSYLDAYPDIAAASVNPLLHFLQSGIHEGRSAFADGAWG